MLISFVSDQIVAAESPFGSYGKIVVTDAASASGAGAIPAPGTISGAPDADWFVHQPVAAEFKILSNSGFESGGGRQYVVDSKAMRKVGPDDDIVGMFDMEVALGGILITQGRMLIQLH